MAFYPVLGLIRKVVWPDLLHMYFNNFTRPEADPRVKPSKRKLSLNLYLKPNIPGKSFKIFEAIIIENIVLWADF